MTNNSKSKQLQKFVLLSSCLLLAFLARNAGAVNVWWDNNGTSAATSGTWDTNTANWSTASTLTASTFTYTNGNFPEFAAGSGTTTALTITINSAVTCAGMASGLSGATVTTTTFNGNSSGSIGITSGLQGFFCEPGSFVYNVPLTGTGGITQHGSGYIALYGTNTYSGGTGTTGGQLFYYNNNNSFGTGSITIGGSGNALVNGGSAAVTITNAFVFSAASYILNLAGGNPVAGAPGTTFTGAFPLPAGVTTLETSSTATEVTEISGVISGTGATLIVADTGTLELGGVNTYTGNTSITNNLGTPTLSIVGSGLLGSGSYASNITNLGIFIYASSASQTLSGVINGSGVVKQTAGTLTLSANNTYSGGTTLSGGTAAIGTFNTPFGSGTITLGGGNINATLNRGTTGTAESLLTPLVISGNSQLQAFPTVANSIRYLQFGSNVSSTAGSLTITNGGTVGGVFCVVLTNTVTLNVPVILTNAVAGNIPQLGVWNYSSVGDQTYNGVISGNGAIYRSTELAAGTGARAIFTAANTYSGGISNNDGEIACGISSVGTPDSGVTSGPLGTGTMTVGNGNAKISAYGGAQVVGNHVILSSSPLTFTGTNSLTMSGNFDFGSAVRTLAVSNTNLTELSGSILNGGLIVSGGNTLTLAGASAYTNATTVSNNSTLALTSSGSISNSASLAILAGSSFNVSAITAYALSSSTALSASGTATSATIKGASGGTVNLGAQPVTLAFDGTDAALTISQGTLVLSNNAFTVNGSALAVGTYTVAHQTSGNISSLSATYPTPTGTAIGAGTTGSITVSGGNVILTIQSTTATTATSSTGGTSTYGQPVAFSATVTGSDGGGTVAFYADGSPTPLPGSSAIPLSGGMATTPSISNLGAGVHSISAAYSGDAASTSSSGSLAGGQTVNPLPVVLTGTRAYDGTNDVSATILAISNNLNGANLTLSGSGTLAGSSIGVQNISSFAGFALGGSAATNYTLTGASGSVTITPGNSAFSGLTASQSVIYGTSAVTLSGTVSATGPVYPASGETITVTINGNAQTTTISDSTGDFSINYNLSGIIYSANPYTITYSYAGDSSFQAASNTSTASTINPPAAPVITTNPAPQTVCNGSVTTFTVAASGSNSYAWYKLANAGWGSVWSATGGGGTFLGSSTNNNNGAPNCNSFSTNGDIDTSSGNSWGLYGGSGGESVVRTFPAVLTDGQVFQIDMDNGGVANGVQNGFALQNSSGAFLFSFYFLGGGSDYVYSDSTAHTTSIGGTVTGLRIQVIVGTNSLGNPAAYSLLVTPCGGSTVEYSGVFAATNGPGQVVLFNNNPYGGATNNLYFNNMFASSAYDDADNYSGNWSGSDEGDALPISGATNTSYTTSSGNNGDLYYAIASNGAGDAASATALLTINPRPTAVVSGSATICTGSSNTVSAVLTGTAPWNVTWSDGTQQNGVASSPATYSPSPSSTTTYTVTNLTDANCTAQPGDLTGGAVVTVNPLPAVSVNSATACAGSSATLTATTSASGPTYLWSPGGATTASITVSPSSTTTYTVTVTDGTTGCTNSGSGTVTINPLPVVSVNSAAVCPGSSATLTATTSASSPSYLWSPGGATTASITVSPSSTTTYTVTVTDGTTGCANSGSGTVTVNPVPTVSVNSPATCAGSSATLTATTSASSPSYLWSPGGATTASITVSPSSNTTYTVTVTDGTTGCANSGSGTVTVNPLPTITLGASPVLTYGSSTNASLPYTATSGSPDGYSITYDPTAQAAGFGNVPLTSLPGSPITLAVPTNAGVNSYNGTLTVSISSTGCTSTNYAFTVTVGPAPLTITANPKTITYGTSVPSTTVSYSGFVNGQTNTALSTQPSIASAQSGVVAAGTYASNYTASGALDSNYTISYVPGTLTVTPASLTITANPQTILYGACVPSTTLSYSGFVNGDTTNSLSSQPTVASAQSGLVAPGTYGSNYTASGAADTNYNISYVAGSLTVNLPTVASLSPYTSFGTNGWLAPGVNGYAYLGTANNERGLAFGNGHLYLLSHASVSGTTANVRILNSVTGADLGGLNNTGISAGTFLVNAAGVGTDGAIYVGNLTTQSTTTPFKVYQWATESSVPTLVYSGNGGLAASRVGDDLAAIGGGSSTLLVAGYNSTPSVTGNNGYAIVSPTLGTVTAIGFAGTPPNAGDFRLGLTFTDSSHVIGTAGSSLYRYSVFSGTSGTLLASPAIPDPSGATADRLMSYAVVDGKALLGVQSTGDSHMSLYDMTSPAAPVWVASGNNTTGTLTANANATGELAWGAPTTNGDGSVSEVLYGTSTDQGIQAFVVTVRNTGLTPVFSGLSNQSITYGTPSVALTGNVGTNTCNPVYPALGDPVSATINGYTVTGAVTNSTGGFSITYNDPSLATNGVSGSPYTITYIYGGNTNVYLNGATNTSTTLTVTPASQTITFGSLTNQTYGVAPFTLSASASSGLGVSFAVVSGPASITSNTITITGAGLVSVQASQAGNSNYSAATPVTNSFTVNPLPVVLTGTETYNGTITVPSSILSVVNKIGSDNVTVASGSASMSSANAGTNALTLPGTLALGGTSASNYTLSGASGSVIVTPLPVVLTGTRAYDGTASAPASILSVSNKVGSDNVTVASGSGTLANASVGSEALTSVGSLALGGTNAGNYTLAGATGSVTITNPFNPFSITISMLDSTGTNLVVCWQSVPGVSYNVLTNTSVGSNGSWMDLGPPLSPVVAVTNITCVSIPGTTNTNAFVLIKQ